jgi:mRNA interferase MazF
VVITQYVPDRGDLVWIDFDHQAGHEQSGRRPALVLSPALYNRRAKLALFCPISSRVKGYAYEVLIPEGSAITGVILADQVKSLDWNARRAEYICSLPSEVTVDTLDKAHTLL